VIDAGPDDFGGSDFDTGFETGWDRMRREDMAREEAKRKEALEVNPPRLSFALLGRIEE
jgi:hypothetical protein